ncbi:MAG: hypothetical protein ACRELV_05120, partial [Longimicrobiales bacterium]
MTMSGPEGSIEERLARLERRVDALQRALDTAGLERTAATFDENPERRASGGRPPTTRLATLTGEAEGWLAKGGIGLVALGLVFLFQYS